MDSLESGLPLYACGVASVSGWCESFDHGDSPVGQRREAARSLSRQARRCRRRFLQGRRQCQENRMGGSASERSDDRQIIFQKIRAHPLLFSTVRTPITRPCRTDLRWSRQGLRRANRFPSARIGMVVRFPPQRAFPGESFAASDFSNHVGLGRFFPAPGAQNEISLFLFPKVEPCFPGLYEMAVAPSTRAPWVARGERIDAR